MNKAIYFKSQSCVVCRDLYPKLAAHFKTTYPLLEWEVIEIEKSLELTAQYNVFTAPVLLIIVEGKEHYRWVRNMSLLGIDEKLGRIYQMKFE